jgi:alkaline phosphatase D
MTRQQDFLKIQFSCTKKDLIGNTIPNCQPQPTIFGFGIFCLFNKGTLPMRLLKTIKKYQTVFTLLFFLTLGSQVFSQTNLLQSGPMVGYSEMREVLLWVQTTESATVKFVYWETGAPDIKYSTDAVKTTKDKAYTAKLIADQVQPGKRYDYELHINGKKVDRPYPLKFQTQKFWQWREEPPSFVIAIGSCAYINDKPYDRPGKPYGRDYEIFTQIYELHPDAMLWLGDNLYLRESEWNTRTGVLYRYTHSRSLPELQPLLGSVHHYAIWDDHDYGPDNSDRSFWNKTTTLEAFELFWGNPSFGINGQPGVTTTFEWADVQFFLLDDRYYRTPDERKTGARTILGKQQFEWLIDALVKSEATFKVIAMGGQVLNPVAEHETYAIFPEEREKLLTTIEKERIKGIVFLSGDRHFTELSKLERNDSYPLYELTVSPLTAGIFDGENEPNYLRVEGTFVGERNFATMAVTGPRSDRRMLISVYNKDGKQLWNYELKSTELR